MADKEATVLIIDLGASMGQPAQGRPMSNLEWSMQYVWDKVTAKVRCPSARNRLTCKVLGARKTDVVGVVGFRTTSTSKELCLFLTVRNGQRAQSRGSISQHHGPPPNSTVFTLSLTGSHPCRILMPQIHSLKKLCVSHKTDKGDGMFVNPQFLIVQQSLHLS